jgi:hypothetical protein
VTERDDETVEVGPEPKEDAKERTENASTDMERIEAKLDYLIALLEE